MGDGRNRPGLHQAALQRRSGPDFGCDGRRAFATPCTRRCRDQFGRERADHILCGRAAAGRTDPGPAERVLHRRSSRRARRRRRPRSDARATDFAWRSGIRYLVPRSEPFRPLCQFPIQRGEGDRGLSERISIPHAARAPERRTLRSLHRCHGGTGKAECRAGAAERMGARRILQAEFRLQRTAFVQIQQCPPDCRR